MGRDNSLSASCIDYGTLTLVLQDNVGGLEVENPHTKHFQPAKPIVPLVLHLDKFLSHRYLFLARDYSGEHWRPPG